MIFAPRITLKQQSDLCRRLAVSIESGIDIRRILEREATTRNSGSMQRAMRRVRQEVLEGRSLTEALEATGNYFPPLFRELAAVGEETGHLAEVLRRLSEHYEHQLKMRRQFLAAITWPMIQLAAAVGIIGVLIWVMGVLPTGIDGRPIDLLGFGLVGTRGLLIYAAIIATLAGAAAVVYQSARRDAFWTRPLIALAQRIPVLGPALATISLSRLAWTLHLALETDMDLRRSLPLALANCGSPRFAAAAPAVVDEIQNGAEVHEALAAHVALPSDFLDALEVGERSGRLPEYLGRLSTQYEDRARHAMIAINVVAGFAVWGLVALLIVMMILRLAMFYIGQINEAVDMANGVR